MKKTSAFIEENWKKVYIYTGDEYISRIFSFEDTIVERLDTNTSINKIANSCIGILSMMKDFTTSYCKTTASSIKNNKKKMSIILSATIVPNPLSNGISLYFFTITALEISPDLGTVKFNK